MSLQASTQGFYILDGGGANIPLTFNGAYAGPNSYAGWEAVHVEASGPGYRVLWKHSDGAYQDWTVNSAGQYVSHVNLGNVADVEVFYGADINNDMVTGHTISDVETTGMSLQASTQGFYILDGGGANIPLTFNGAYAGPNSYAGWEAVHVEASGPGYRVLWKHSDGAYQDWTVNSAGQYVSHVNLGNVADVEVFYGADINNDMVTGHTISDVETTGMSLQASTQGFYILDGGGANIPLTFNGAYAGPNSYAGWEAVHVEASGPGYRVLWKHSDGAYQDWTVNSAGQYVSHVNLGNVADVEVFYGADIDGSGFIGTSPPKLTQLSDISQDHKLDASMWITNNDIFEFISNTDDNSSPTTLDDEYIENAQQNRNTYSPNTSIKDIDISSIEWNNINIPHEDEFLFI